MSTWNDWKKRLRNEGIIMSSKTWWSSDHHYYHTNICQHTDRKTIVKQED